MRYFLDCEFVEDGKTIDPISIGIVAEDSRTLYLGNINCKFELSSEWVKNNVLVPMGFQKLPNGGLLKPMYMPLTFWKIPEEIAREVAEFMGAEEYYKSAGHRLTGFRLKSDEPKPEVWSDYGSYDWVALSQGFPMYINDIQQECNRLGNPDLPEQTLGNHNALEDAKWVKEVHGYLRQIDLVQKVEPKNIQIGTNNYRTAQETQDHLRDSGLSKALGVNHLL